MTNIQCFNLYRRRGLNSVDLFWLPSVCKQPVVNGWQELGRSFHKQKIGENGMAIQEDWRQLKVPNELVDKISWKFTMNELQVWRENNCVGFGATFVPTRHQLDLQILKTCSVYNLLTGFWIKMNLWSDVSRVSLSLWSIDTGDSGDILRLSWNAFWFSF